VFLFYQPLIPAGVLALSEEESKHAVKVLRLTEGSEIEIADGHGHFYGARITHADPKKCAFSIHTTSFSKRRDYRIHIAVAPTKNIDRTEWFVEKAVEFGIDEITFVECKKSERRVVNLDRFEKLIVSALKQSRQPWLPVVNPITPFPRILATKATERYISYVDHTNPLQLKAAAPLRSDYLVLIGPEGDFAEEELAAAIQAGFQKVALGPSRLRTETAALAACMTLNLVNQ
jgi:16S rRNA (uracil1498-N3)-methyltransferase